VQSLVRKELSSHNLHRCGDCLHVVEMFTRAQLVILITFVGVVIVSIGKDGGGGEPT
jgi:ribosomal protein S27E